MAPVATDFIGSRDMKDRKQRSSSVVEQCSSINSSNIPEGKSSLPVATSGIFGMTRPTSVNHDVIPRASQGWLDWLVMPMGSAKMKDLNVIAPVST